MLNKLINILENNNVFLTGGAGVGKSYLTKQLRQFFINKKKKVISLGSTALSAFNINGLSVHSFFCFGRCDNLEFLLKYDKKQKEKIKKLEKILKKTDLIIIDEISMISADVFNMIYFRLNSLSFDGRLLVVGDFFQLPPIKKEDNKTLFSNGYYAFSSLYWKEFNFVNLKLNISKRTNNIEFFEKLSMLRNGKIQFDQLQYFSKFLIEKDSLDKYESDYTILCGINKKANLINEINLQKINSKEEIFKAKIEKIDKNLDDEVLDAWLKGLNILDDLKVKIGAKIIFCLNNKDQNYYNGEQGIIKDIFKEDDKTYIQILKSNNTTIVLESFKFKLEDLEDDTIIKATCEQFPIKLAYAITIHKSQGMSIEKLVCDIDNIFEKGQLYVALSRAINPEFLKIYYSKNVNFINYFSNMLKFDYEVLRFYKENEFINLE